MMKDLFGNKLLETHSDSEKKLKRASNENALDDTDLSLMENEFLRRQLLALFASEDQVTVDEKSTDETINSLINEELNDFCDYVLKMDLVTAVLLFPLECDKELTQENLKRNINDPEATFALFDCFKWWKDVGEQKWPMVAACALVVFSKPQHNGFQERVFSRGTFTDDQLRRRMKESTFEMTILESLNSDKVETYLKFFRENNNMVDNEDKMKTDSLCQYVKALLNEDEKLNDWDNMLDDSNAIVLDEEYVVEVDDFLSNEESEIEENEKKFLCNEK
jgi:hypothetical protein